MTVNRPIAERHDAEYFRSRRVPAPKPMGEPARQIEAPRIRHYGPFGTTRPLAAPLPPEPLRLTREEIEAALVGGFTYHPDPAAVVDRILLATARLDQHPPGSDMFNMHHQTIMRELRMLGLYPV